MAKAHTFPVPRDLSNVKTKVFANLTVRQLCCFGGAALIGVPLFFVMRQYFSMDTSLAIMVVAIMPLFLLAMYERDGQPFEVVLKNFYEAVFHRPKIRPYQTSDVYSALMRSEKAEQEVNEIVRKAQKRSQKSVRQKGT